MNDGSMKNETKAQCKDDASAAFGCVFYSGW
jgi:hypothetical protein